MERNQKSEQTQFLSDLVAFRMPLQDKAQVWPASTRSMTEVDAGCECDYLAFYSRGSASADNLNAGNLSTLFVQRLLRRKAGTNFETIHS